jgi:hypothetical protein
VKASAAAGATLAADGDLALESGIGSARRSEPVALEEAGVGSFVEDLAECRGEEAEKIDD